MAEEANTPLLPGHDGSPPLPPFVDSGPSASTSSSSSASLRRLAIAKSYGTFLVSGLGLSSSSQPQMIVTPSKGKAREVDPSRTAAAAGGGGTAAGDAHWETRPDGSEETRWSTLRSWVRINSKDLYLANVGSVARDHLANERTFLAWLRTSLSLASIGVAITQLFRLSSSTYTLPADPDRFQFNPDTITSSPQTDDSLLPSIASEADLRRAVASLILRVQQQQLELFALGTSTERERAHYHRLGKPIGGTFILLGLLFLLLGGHRYLSVQHHLANKNYFPPARRSILLASAFVCALLVSSFASVLIIR